MANRQAGQGKVGCFLWLVALAIASMAAYKMIPVRIQAAEFYDFMDEQAKWAANRPADAIKKVIVDRGKELGIPLDPDNVKVEKLSGDRIRMEAKYTVPVEFPGYTYNWEFHHQIERQIFIF